MHDETEDVLARYDELELIELGEADAHGGSTWACAIATAASAVVTTELCPTTKCTSKC
ncbi:class II lanthipeptide, LchA2/BrtA2 family [Streptomyces boninensis]|uniref:class II lanthipeptide, LchA2/BrtA2 family n=1 Tax=Streptomyces boninensis TaxID=2039455 RepID=UPI003B219346